MIVQDPPAQALLQLDPALQVTVQEPPEHSLSDDALSSTSKVQCPFGQLLWQEPLQSQDAVLIALHAFATGAPDDDDVVGTLITGPPVDDDELTVVPLLPFPLGLPPLDDELPEGS